MPTLQLGNQEQLVRHISFDWLSKTFQDAVVFTRRLCFLFLWIDALCIVQDDPDDVGFTYHVAFIHR